MYNQEGEKNSPKCDIIIVPPFVIFFFLEQHKSRSSLNPKALALTEVTDM